MLYLKIYWFLQSCQGHFALDFEEDFSKLRHRFCHSSPPHTQPHPPLEKQPFNIVALQAVSYVMIIWFLEARWWSYQRKHFLGWSQVLDITCIYYYHFYSVLWFSGFCFQCVHLDPGSNIFKSQTMFYRVIASCFQLVAESHIRTVFVFHLGPWFLSF